jgi:hypothetical protein
MTVPDPLDDFRGTRSRTSGMGRLVAVAGGAYDDFAEPPREGEQNNGKDLYADGRRGDGRG